MSYTIIWTPYALEQLAELWLEAGDQARVTMAANELDKLLGADPHHERHEIVNGLGTAICPPLGIDFRIREGDKTISVFAVWLVAVEDM